eukprot:4231613-Amphidinium_carterae.1
MMSTCHMSFYLALQSCARTSVRAAETVMATLRKEAEELRMGKKKAKKQKGGAQLAQSVMELASSCARPMPAHLQREFAGLHHGSKPVLARMDLREELFQGALKEMVEVFVSKWAESDAKKTKGRVLRGLVTEGSEECESEMQRFSSAFLKSVTVTSMEKLEDSASVRSFLQGSLFATLLGSEAVLHEKLYLPTVRVTYQGSRTVVAMP